jgi:hypothetical protein
MKATISDVSEAQAQLEKRLATIERHARELDACGSEEKKAVVDDLAWVDESIAYRQEKVMRRGRRVRTFALTATATCP